MGGGQGCQIVLKSCLSHRFFMWEGPEGGGEGPPDGSRGAHGVAEGASEAGTHACTHQSAQQRATPNLNTRSHPCPPPPLSFLEFARNCCG